MSNEKNSDGASEWAASAAAATVAVGVGIVATPAIIVALACAPLALLGAAAVDSACNKKK